MTNQVEAVYHNGLLRPLEPLALEEHQRVTVVISEVGSLPERSYLDAEYLASVREETASQGLLSG
jgi:predicted DNA-binding antitoxin AbrB/MazE fold protein